tara:strand:+ start:163 stop:384 length:222 start_codon:yes stop_codon:yes gene_type:complete
LHDAISSERLGTPAVGVMTNKFISAADLMAKVLGSPGFQYAIIDHPVSSASDEELAEKAAETLHFINSLVLLK